VVVVDDGSPRAAEEELAADLRTALPGLTLIRQANRGIAAARNAGLDALTAGVTAIAFLDSDDSWHSSHLRSAAAALSQGADFFFTNFTIAGAPSDQFHAQARSDLLDNRHPVQGATGIQRWTGGVSALMAPGCPFATSAVVFRRALMPQMRFPLEYRRAGEDQVAWWELLARAAAVMYCCEPSVTFGSEGLGTWQNSAFGSVAHLVRLADEIHFRRYVLGRHPLSAGDRRALLEQIAARRDVALGSALHLLRRREPGVFRELLYLWRSDPPGALRWCGALPRLIYRKVRHATPTAPLR